MVQKVFFFFKKLLFHYINFCYILQRSLCEEKRFNSVCKTECIGVIKLRLFLKQGGKVNYFCRKQIQQGFKAFPAHLYPYFP